MAKSLVFLFDGTANDASVESYTNVYMLNQLIAESKSERIEGKTHIRTQVTFYLPGVGTKFTVRRPVRKGALFWRYGDPVRQQIFGDGLEQMILRAYVNLCANFKAGDTIVCVGFSRGAAAARIFTRLISDLGILVSEKSMLLDRVWNEFVEISKIQEDHRYFEEIGKIKSEMHAAFDKQSVFHDEAHVSIDFLGVFDTVIGTIDDGDIHNCTMRDLSPASKVTKAAHVMSMHDVRKDYELKRFEVRQNSPCSLREIWMPGVHSDIGGGYIEDLLGNISLLTMADLIAASGSLALEKAAYEQVVERVRAKYKLGPMKINKEPFVIRRESRSHSLRATDEIHPLHWHLSGKNVYWKDVPTPMLYEDRYKQNVGKTDVELEKNFRSWLGYRMKAKPRRQLASRGTF